MRTFASLLVGLLLLINVGPALGQGTDELPKKQFLDAVVVRKFAQDTIEGLRSKQSPTEFTATCKALAKTLSDIVKEASSLPDNTANLTSLVSSTQTKLRSAILDNSKSDEAATAWVEVLGKKIEELKQLKQDPAFNATSVKARLELYSLAAGALEFAAEHAPPDANRPNISVEDFLHADFRDQVYERLVELKVVKLDDLFPQTCEKLAAAIRKTLTDADKSASSNGPDLAEKCIVAILAVIEEQTKGDPQARQAWALALKEFVNKLAADDHKVKYDPQNVGHVRHAFMVLADGLSQSISEDEKAIANILTNRTGVSPSLGTQQRSTVSRTSHAAVHHERVMSRIEAGHERRMDKIQRIRAR